MDYNSAIGGLHALQLAAMCEDGGGSLSAPVCSTWVALNKGTSGCSYGRPLGNYWYRSVAEANLQVSRLVLTLVVLSA
eukprot:14056699-Alexandrium_andersonii.AAC.1